MQERHMKMDLAPEDCRWKLLKNMNKANQFRSAERRPIYQPYNDPSTRHVSSNQNSYSSRYSHQQRNDTESITSSTYSTSTGFSRRGTSSSYVDDNHRYLSHRRQQGDLSDRERSSCASIRSTRERTFDNRDRRMQRQLPYDNDNNIPPRFRFNRGRDITHRSSNNDDRHATRHTFPEKQIKFVLSSSSRKRPSNFDDADEPERKVIYIGYKYLQTLNEKKPHDIICEIVKSNSPFAAYLNEPELEADWLIHVVEILKNVCSSSFTGNIHEMLNHVLRSQLMHALIYYLNDIETETNKETIAKMKTFVENLSALLSSITNILPLIAVERNVKKVITKTIAAIDKVNNEFQAGVDETLKQKLETLVMRIDNYENISKQKPSSSSIRQSSRQDALSEMPPPDDFRTISLYPTQDDLKIISKFIFIRPNKVKGAYQDIEHYLDVQFRLLREDFIYPLRIGLKEYAEEKAALGTKPTMRLKSKYESVRFYRDTKFESRCTTKSHDVGYILTFDPERRLKISWAYSKRFIYGSLLLFTTNDFETFFFGTVLERDETSLGKGQIVVKLPLDVEITEKFFERKYLVAESEVFFEPYYQVMRRLQTFKENEFPMPKFIVFGETVTELPSYLKKLQPPQTIENLAPVRPGEDLVAVPPDEENLAVVQPENPDGLLLMDFGVNHDGLLDDEEGPKNEPAPLVTTKNTNNSYWNVLGHHVDVSQLSRDDHWPTASQLKMDVSQYEAFKTALTSNFCVIQGPPGTGKTFIGLKIVQVLLENMVREYSSVQQIRPPILVVCYTNHALDQFLEGIVPFTNKIVRAGSRSNSEVLRRFNLRGANQISIRHQAKSVHRAKSLVETKVRHLYEKLQRLSDLRAKIEKPCGILKYELLEGVMAEQHKQHVRDEQEMMDWLLWQPDDEDFNYTRCPDEKPVLRYNQASREAKNEERKWTNDDKKRDSHDSEDNDQLVDELLQIEIAHIGSPFCVKLADFEILQQNFNERLSEIEEEMRMETNRKVLSVLWNAKQKEHYLFRRKIREYDLLVEQLENPRFDRKQCQNILKKNIRHVTRMDQRWLLYWSWLEKVKEITVNQLNATEKEYANKLEQLNEYRQIEDVYVIERAEVVGMTTTCAARLHHVLETIKPAVVIIEEAAEVLESHIVASLTDACEHVILIGDHKQLKPSAAVYHLCKTYNFDVSLFERMINNGMYCPMLRVQHRMRPEISKLITPLIYPNLEDHNSVRKYQPINGMMKSVFFLEHNEFEEEVHDSSSRKNRFEALFLLRLCEYLVHQGYNPSKITILTTYSGQMFLLRELKKREYPALADVRCIVVDKYQGEENDIILLSLVRSNADAKIGFLKIENRVCVALSRAKKGLYMVGNMDNLRASGPLWEEIHRILQEDGASGKEMQLYCKTHELVTTVSKPEDFDKVSQGGCNMACAVLMKCGHLCPSICHKIDHDYMRCYEPCPKTCIRQHPCKQYCYEVCDPCTVVENRKLPCSHETDLPCHVDENEYVCQTIMDDVSPVCGHPIKRKCGEIAEQTKCLVRCDARLDCGHACPRMCHKTNDPDHLKFKCHRPCERLNEKCSRSHQCKKQCHEDCGLCTVFVKMTLPCGHQESLPCFTDLNEHQCFQRCQKSCPECKGECKKLCYENCAPCPNLVEKTIEECGHKVEIKCSKEAIRENCSKACERLRPCGHKCKALCSKPCGLDKCYELIKTDQIQALCGHNDFVRIYCYQQDQVDNIDREKLIQHCQAPCDTKLKCGDMCVGTCGQCWQGRMHTNCQEDCRNVLICGHICKVKCREECPPCDEKCGFKCEHSYCPNKCGVPCVKCKEKCRWRCQHLKCSRKCGEICDREPCFKACRKSLTCGHPCIGYCGEPCPTQCRICNPEITDILFGWEDEPDARFVLLNDCGHVIESRALDKHVQMPPEGGEIVVKACPLCKTPIVTTLRFMNIVKETYRHIINIKRKIFGNPLEIMTKGEHYLADSFRAVLENHVQLIRLADLTIMDRVIRKFVNFLHKRIHSRRQVNISTMEITAITFFHNVIRTVLSRLGDLFDLVDVKQVVRRERYNLGQFSSRIKVHVPVKKTERQLDKSIAATKTLELVRRLMERIDVIFLRLGQQQSEDISLEIARYTKMVDYCLALRRFPASKNLEQVVAVRTKIEEILFGLSRFIPEQRETLEHLFQELEKGLKSNVPLTKEEKQMIHLAMSKDFHGGSQSKGHWFTCTRGHYYCITECGGATQESKCPECGEKIGGQNHRYVNTIRVASDMDGATRPAWSSGNDMRNYGRFF